MSYKFKPRLQLHTQFQLFINMIIKRFGASNLSGTVNSDRLKECHRRSITANTGNHETASVLLLCLHVDDKTPSQTKWASRASPSLSSLTQQK
ncbi:hypothetical protein N7501_010940 [Penicillium viridicatum]|nr:hypothetical protein N7501_010940 [Penicillium viridicatum]